MAIFKTRKLKRETAKKKRYLEHYKKAGPRHAMTYGEWMKKGEQPAYFKGIKQGTVESGLREAGIDPARFKRKKR